MIHKVSVIKTTTEIRLSLNSSRFYTVEYNSVFGLSLSIKMTLTDKLNRGEFKLVYPKLPFLCCRVYETSLTPLQYKKVNKSNNLRPMEAKIAMVNPI